MAATGHTGGHPAVWPISRALAGPPPRRGLSDVGPRWFGPSRPDRHPAARPRPRQAGPPPHTNNPMETTVTDPLDPHHQETLRTLAAVWPRLTDGQRAHLTRLVDGGHYRAAAHILATLANPATA